MRTAHYVDQILADSNRLADVARGHFDMPVAACPGWTVADLVDHVRKVHWLWEWVARERLTEEPDDDVEYPPRPTDEALINTFLVGAQRLADTLRTADQDAPVWTWSGPDDQRIGFITRHQVQEAAVHRWDAEQAVGATSDLPADLAADAVDEFLSCSLASERYPKEQALDATLMLSATDTGDTWAVTDGATPGSLRAARCNTAATADATMEASAWELLLWLYRRIELEPTDGRGAEVVRRFVAMTYTD